MLAGENTRKWKMACWSLLTNTQKSQALKVWLRPRRWALNPTLEPPKMEKCNVHWCQKPCFCKGLCKMHDTRRRRGQPMEPKNLKKVPVSFAYDKSDILEALERFVANFGRTPLRIEWEEMRNYPSPGTVTNHFGSWNNLMIEAGYAPRPKRGTPYSRQERIKDPIVRQ